MNTHLWWSRVQDIQATNTADDFVVVAPTLANANANVSISARQEVQSRIKQLETILVEEPNSALATKHLCTMASFFSHGDTPRLCVEPSSFAILVSEAMQCFVQGVRFSTEAFTMMQLIVEASLIRLLRCAILASVDKSVAVLRMPPHTAEILKKTTDTTAIVSALKAFGEQMENPLPIVGHGLALLLPKDIHLAQKFIAE
eukprot:m.234198 g.234198  ORF g.234198 m.234198 type:complete len:201 (+) comp33652_c1_seq10:2977-3579(+)